MSLDLRKLIKEPRLERRFVFTPLPLAIYRTQHNLLIEMKNWREIQLVTYPLGDFNCFFLYVLWRVEMKNT